MVKLLNIFDFFAKTQPRLKGNSFQSKNFHQESKLENLVFLSLCQDMQYLLAMLCGNVLYDDIQEQSSQNIGM